MSFNNFPRRLFYKIYFETLKITSKITNKNYIKKKYKYKSSDIHQSMKATGPVQGKRDTETPCIHQEIEIYFLTTNVSNNLDISQLF